jgi:hypothetical protein
MGYYKYKRVVGRRVHQGNVINMTNIFVSLQEAYFAIQTVDVYAICTSGSRRDT